MYFMSTVEDSIKIPSMASADLRRCSQVKKGGKDKLRKILLGSVKIEALELFWAR